MYQGLVECEQEGASMAEEYGHTPPELKAWVRLPPSAPFMHFKGLSQYYTAAGLLGVLSNC